MFVVVTDEMNEHFESEHSWIPVGSDVFSNDTTIAIDQ
jgi:hypothetical protein